jgi:hypothetical protein
MECGFFGVDSMMSTPQAPREKYTLGVMTDADSGCSESPAAKHVLVSDRARQEGVSATDVIPGGCTGSG